MIETEINIRLRCRDGVSVHATIIHNLPFIPSLADDVTIFLPAMPEVWDEESWYGNICGIWINADGTVGVNIEAFDCTEQSDDVANALIATGWHAFTTGNA